TPGGDGLTPRAVRQLAAMGLGDRLGQFPRFEGLRATAHGRALELPWPPHPEFPPYGYVVRRRDLDEFVAENAVKAGATLWQGAEAVAPVVDRGFVRGAVVRRRGASAPGAARAQDVGGAGGRDSPLGRGVRTFRPAAA